MSVYIHSRVGEELNKETRMRVIIIALIGALIVGIACAHWLINN